MSEQNKSSNNNSFGSGKKEGEKKDSPRFPMWIYVVLILALLGIQVYFMGGQAGGSLKYSEFLSYVEKRVR